MPAGDTVTSYYWRHCADMLNITRYANVSTVCPALIKAGWDALATHGATPEGRLEVSLQSVHRSCTGLASMGGWLWRGYDSYDS